MKDDEDKKLARRRQTLIRAGTIIGVALAVVCRSIPVEYREICGFASQILPLMCGGGT